MSDIEPLSADARAVLDAARNADEPSSSDRARNRLALAAKLGAAGAGVTAATVVASKTSSSVSLALFGKILVGLSLLGGVVWVGRTTLSRDASSSASPNTQTFESSRSAGNSGEAEQPRGAVPSNDSNESAAAVNANEPHAPSSDDKSEAKTGAAKSQKNVARGASTVMDADALEGEVKQLSEAQKALAQGDNDKALALLDGKQAGPLAAERAGARAIALCQAGKLDEGARVAAQFLKSYPSSPLASKVRAACARRP